MVRDQESEELKPNISEFSDDTKWRCWEAEWICKSPIQERSLGWRWKISIEMVFSVVIQGEFTRMSKKREENKGWALKMSTLRAWEEGEKQQGRLRSDHWSKPRVGCSGSHVKKRYRGQRDWLYPVFLISQERGKLRTNSFGRAGRNKNWIAVVISDYGRKGIIENGYRQLVQGVLLEIRKQGSIRQGKQAKWR